MKCIQCQAQTTNPKFYSRSCAARCNGIKFPKRAKLSRKPCLVCGKLGKTPDAKYCSNVCSSSVRRKSDHHINGMNALRQSRYRAKKYRTMAPDADHEKIKQIYLNCPPGHEVDHIIPVSRGGLHHEDNLQYLPVTENRKKGNRIGVVQEAGIEPTRSFENPL